MVRPTKEKKIKIDELLEALCFYNRFVENIDEILKGLDANEQKDHINDSTRNEAMQLIISAMKENAAGSKNLVDRNLNMAYQILQRQEREDLEDDIPRLNARNQLIKLKNKAVELMNNLKISIKNLESKNAKN